MKSLRNYKVWASVLPLSLLWAFTPPAHAKNSLNCTVADETGKPLPKQEVLLSLAGSPKEQKKKTNDKGEVEFKGLDDGAYTLSVELTGYVGGKSAPIELSGNVDKPCKYTAVSANYANDKLKEVMQFIQQRKFADAEEKAKSVIALMPGIGEPHQVLAIAYAYQGKEQEAVTEIKRAADFNPDKFKPLQGPIQVAALNTQADALKQKGDFPGAIKKYEEMLKIAPNDATILYNMAVTFAFQKNFDEALKNIDLVLAIKPDDQEAKLRKDQWEKQFEEQLKNPLGK